MKRSLVVCFAALLFAAPVLANYGPVFVSRVNSVYDGDTFRVDIDAWPGVVGEDMPVRIKHIDTPEKRSRCATEAEKERERRLAAEAEAFTRSRLENAETITLHDISRGTFFRLVADVLVDGADLGTLITAAGYSIPFGSGDWCQGSH